MSNMNIPADAKLHNTGDLAKQVLHEGFQINRDLDGSRRATATFGVHAAVTAGALRAGNMDNWPKPLVSATIDFERRMLALVDAAQPVMANAGIKLDQNLQPAQPQRAAPMKVNLSGPKPSL